MRHYLDSEGETASQSRSRRRPWVASNRDNSADSRFGFGSVGHSLVFVPSGNIKGKAAVIWLSFSASWDIRWERFGKVL